MAADTAIQKRGPGGKRSGRPRTSAEAIEIRKRHCEWLDKKLAGMTYQQIADEYDVWPNAVFEAVDNLLREMPAEDAENLRQQESKRLDRQLTRLERAAKDALAVGEPDPAVEAVLLKNIERRCKLLGLDLPVVKSNPEQVDIEELRKLLNAAGYEIVPKASVVEGSGEGSGE